MRRSPKNKNKMRQNASKKTNHIVSNRYIKSIFNILIIYIKDNNT